jgi:hypothetical protein
MPAVHVTYATGGAAVCDFDGDPFAVVAQTNPPGAREEWSIFDVRQWDLDGAGFLGAPALGVSATREHGIRVAVAHAG